MKRGVGLPTCGDGGAFHEGTGGRSEGEDASKAKGKLSVTGGRESAGGLYLIVDVEFVSEGGSEAEGRSESGVGLEPRGGLESGGGFTSGEGCE